MNLRKLSAFSIVSVGFWATASCGSGDAGGRGGARGGGAAPGGGGPGGRPAGGTTSTGGSTGTDGAAGGAGTGGVDINELGKPCVADKCPDGLTAVTFCGIAGCAAGQV